MKKTGGFSLIESLIVIAIMAALVGVASVSLFNMRQKSDMDATRSKIVATLNEARSRAVSQEDGESWGVRFENNYPSVSYYVLFNSNYSISTEKGRYSLPKNVEYVSSSVPVGSPRDIQFLELSGKASGTPQIPLVLKIPPFTTSTITISSSGIISY